MDSFRPPWPSQSHLGVGGIGGQIRSSLPGRLQASFLIHLGTISGGILAHLGSIWEFFLKELLVYCHAGVTWKSHSNTVGMIHVYRGSAAGTSWVETSGGSTIHIFSRLWRYQSQTCQGSAAPFLPPGSTRLRCKQGSKEARGQGSKGARKQGRKEEGKKGSKDAMTRAKQGRKNIDPSAGARSAMARPSLWTSLKWVTAAVLPLCWLEP